MSLLLGLTGVALAGCSSPAEGGGGPPAPPMINPDFTNGNSQGQAGAGVQAPVGGSGGTGGLGAGLGGSGSQVTPQGGTGGSAVATAGSGGMPGGGEIPIGMGTVITPAADGWVAGGTNQFGIQGSFYTFSDAESGGDTTMNALDFTGGRVCTSGIASQVLTPAGALEPAYGTYWGGGVGLNLADPGNMTGPGPWDRGSVVGFSFNITGSTVPPADQFRFKATFYEGTVVNEEGYCIGNVLPGQNSIQLGSLVNQCYTGGAMAPALSPTAQLVALQWQIATVTAASTPFDFCIENLTPLAQ